MAISYNPPHSEADGFSELAVKAMSDYAVFAAHNNLAKLQLFSHTFTELNGRAGETIAVPVYDLSAGTDFNLTTNNYGTGVNEIGGLLVTLDKHYCKSVSIMDADLAFTGINWARDTAGALAERITRDINDYVFGTALAGDSTTSAEIQSADISGYIPDTGADEKVIAKLYALAEGNTSDGGKDMPADKCVVVLKPAQFATVLGLAKYSTLGSGEYIKTGVLPGLFGFKGFVCSPTLPTGWKGAVVLDEAIGVASKYLAPSTAGSYPQAWSATDDNGFTIGFRRYMDLATGRNNFAVEALFGAKLLQPSKIIKLV